MYVKNGGASSLLGCASPLLAAAARGAREHDKVNQPVSATCSGPPAAVGKSSSKPAITPAQIYAGVIPGGGRVSCTAAHFLIAAVKHSSVSRGPCLSWQDVGAGRFLIHVSPDNSFIHED